MIATPLALLALLAALPEGAARYRAELGGVAVGISELRIACAGVACAVRWGARLRAPAEAGGGVTEVGVEVEVDRDGRFRGGPLRVRRGGRDRSPAGVPGAVPASIVEVVLALEAGRDGGCVPFFDEERPERRSACARRSGGALSAEVGRVAVSIVPDADGLPREVSVAGRFRWVRDPSATLPLEAPRLAGTRVAGPADPRAARRFCGVPLDPEVDEAPDGALPPPRAEGTSCREKTARWLEAARLLGSDGRTAVGVAWDGQAFVWHAWAEVRSGDGWLPVDPSFEQRPARGPRFTLARHREGDPSSQDAAGARVLECWGSAIE